MNSEKRGAEEEMVDLWTAASNLTAEMSTAGNSFHPSLHSSNSAVALPTNPNSTHNQLSNDAIDEEVPMTFPQKLMEILSVECHSNTIAWLPHGKGFIIYKKKKFASDILPLYFKQSKFTSFTRKLNRWGFTRVTRGPETGAYYHKFFIRDMPKLCMQMTCQSNRTVSSSSAAANIPQPPIAAAAATTAIPNSTSDLFSSVAATMSSSGQPQPPQSNDLICHQWQQLQLQQLQLQQLQMQQHQQQQQFQAAEMLRQAMQSTTNDNNSIAAPVSADTNRPSQTHATIPMSEPDLSFLWQTLQQQQQQPQVLQQPQLPQKQKNDMLLMGNGPIALLPALQATNMLPASMSLSADASNGGNGRAWAA